MIGWADPGGDCGGGGLTEARGYYGEGHKSDRHELRALLALELAPTRFRMAC